MKSAQELLQKASIALVHPALVKFARELSPTAAYEAAVAARYTEEQARSCRFLAILRRDYGEDSFLNVLDWYEGEREKGFFEEKVYPDIHLLELLLGGPLQIVGPRDKGKTLCEYMMESNPVFLDLALAAGNFNLTLRWTFDTGETSGSFLSHHRLTTREGEVISEHSSRISGGVVGNHQHFRRSLGRYLSESLMWSPECSGMGNGSLLKDLLKWHQDRGETVLPHPYESEDIRESVGKGWVERSESLIAQLRASYKKPEVKSWAYAVFDRGARLLLAEARRKQRKYDPSVPLIQKLQEGLYVSPCQIVPGTPAKKNYAFLFNGAGCELDLLVRRFARLGYAGSLIVTEMNYPTTRDLARSGQFDGFMVWNAGASSKEWVLEEMQAELRERGLPPVPEHYSDDYGVWDQLESFIVEHFPVS